MDEWIEGRGSWVDRLQARDDGANPRANVMGKIENASGGLKQADAASLSSRTISGHPNERPILPPSRNPTPLPVPSRTWLCRMTTTNGLKEFVL